MNPQSEEGTPSLDLEGIDLHRQKLLRQLKVVTKRAFALILEQVRFSRADVFTQKRLDVLHINTRKFIVEATVCRGDGQDPSSNRRP